MIKVNASDEEFDRDAEKVIGTGSCGPCDGVRAEDALKPLPPIFEFCEVLGLCDEVSYWFWTGKNVGGIEESVGRLRDFVGKEKPILLGQYMWDFGGKREMPVELMSNQLMASERLPKSRQISGLIFHCTPLVDLALAAVNLSRKWIAEHRNEVV